MKIGNFYKNSNIIVKNVKFVNSTFIDTTFLLFNSNFEHSI